MPMTRFLQKFDQLPKLSLGGELGGASINEKFAELTGPTRKRDLYFITFHPCQSVTELHPGRIGDALNAIRNCVVLDEVIAELKGGCYCT
jgi:hypothetical protein